MENECEVCGSPGKFECGGCGVAFYCSEKHAKEGWERGHGCACGVFDLERETERNVDYRRVVATLRNEQLVLMSLLPGEAVDMEMHPDTDQFLRVEKGSVEVAVRRRRDGPEVRHVVGAGQSFFVPAGVFHEVDASEEGAKLYTIYSPPEHPRGTVQRTKPKAAGLK